MSIQFSTGRTSQSNWSRQKKFKVIQIKREEVKLWLFADDMILHTENLKEPVKKLFELINDFSKVARYKINIQKSITFLYINNEASDREIKKKTIPFTIA